MRAASIVVLAPLLIGAGVLAAAAQGGGSAPAWVDPPRRLPQSTPAEVAKPAEPPLAVPAKPQAPALTEAAQPPEAPRDVRIIPPATAPERPVSTAVPPVAPAMPIPPATPTASAPAAPVPPPPEARGTAPAPPTRETREAVAARFVDEYLARWSSPNEGMLDAMPAFYGSRVEFHGREVGLGSVLREKERLARRWPLRRYVLRAESRTVTCSEDRRLCLVRGVFDFTVANERRRRQNQGASNLEIVVDFSGERPVIVAEDSRPLSRGEWRRQQIGAADE